MEQQIHLPKVRKILVEKAIEDKRLEEAKKLLAEGIRLAEEAQHPGTVRDWEETLLRIAETEKDITMVRFFSEKFAFGRSFNSSYYQQWKNTYNSEERADVVKNKIDAISARAAREAKGSPWRKEDHWLLYELGPIYVEEQMFDRLLDLVKRDCPTKCVNKKYGVQLCSL